MVNKKYEKGKELIKRLVSDDSTELEFRVDHDLCFHNTTIIVDSLKKLSINKKLYFLFDYNKKSRYIGDHRTAYFSLDEDSLKTNAYDIQCDMQHIDPDGSFTLFVKPSLDEIEAQSLKEDIEFYIAKE